MSKYPNWLSGSKHPIIAELPGWAEKNRDTLRDFVISLHDLVDAILLPDLPTGRIRVDSILTASRIRSFSDIELIAGVSARHRSLEASISRLLAFWELGIKDLYIVMGDSTPSSSSSKVYDYLRTTQLISIAKNIRNEGKKIGLSFPADISFNVGSALLPLRKNECELVKKKIRAGADYFITQIVFDHKVIEDFFSTCDADLSSIPLFISLPIISKPVSLSKLKTLEGIIIPREKEEKLLKSSSMEEECVKMNVETFERCKRLGVGKLGAYILPLPGSKMEDRMAKELKKL